MFAILCGHIERGPVAQLGAPFMSNGGVGGSSPSRPTCASSSMVERPDYHGEVGGSSPSMRFGESSTSAADSLQ